MIDAKRLSGEQLDALKEVANIGSGHAATSLSQLMNKKVMVRVPKILTGPLEDVILKIADPNLQLCLCRREVIRQLKCRNHY